MAPKRFEQLADVVAQQGSALLEAVDPAGRHHRQQGVQWRLFEHDGRVADRSHLCHGARAQQGAGKQYQRQPGQAQGQQVEQQAAGAEGRADPYSQVHPHSVRPLRRLRWGGS